jgi:META domain
MTETMPGLEAAIRAGVERGFDAAPVVPDLAERVRALPPPRRSLPMLAVAASVAAVLIAVAVVAAWPRSTPDQPTAGQSTPAPTATSAVSPTPTTSSPPPAPLVGPPYSVVTRTDDTTTAARAVGTWQPVWLAGYDGSLLLSGEKRPAVRVEYNDGGPATSGGVRVGGQLGCAATSSAWISTTGRLLNSGFGGELVDCTLVNGVLNAASVADGNSATRMGVSSDGTVLTVYGKTGPVEQLVRSGASIPASQDWSVSGDLAAALLRGWNVMPAIPPVARNKAPLGGIVQLSFAAGGRWSGTDGCNEFGGRYQVSFDGQATFTVRNLTATSCTEHPYTPTSIMDVKRIAHFGDLLEFYDAKGDPITELRGQVPSSIVGTWERPSKGPEAMLTFESDGTLSLAGACGADRWTYALDPDGRFSATVLPSSEKCVGPVDPGGMVSALKAATRLAQTSTGELVLYDAAGVRLATLVGVVFG